LALVLHLSPDRPSALIDVLARQTRLRVRWAEDGARLGPGVLVVAPPDRHLLFQGDGTISLGRAPLVHHSRPSVDTLFASAARAFGARTLAVILTGNGQDGSDAVPVVHDLGGVVIAQDEASSQYFSMPHRAIESGGVSFVLPLIAIAPALERLVAFGVEGGGAPPPGNHH
jgi:two-component system chemotaxis response regulator CheB